jgi:hypothetical protein
MQSARPARLVLDHVVRQDRAATATRIKTRTIEAFDTLQQQVNQAGTTEEAARIWQEGAPKVQKDLERFATDAGLPEAVEDLRFTGAQVEAEIRTSLAKRVAVEAAAAGEENAVVMGNSMVQAGSEVEFTRRKAQLHQTLTQLAADNPLVSPADATRLYRTTVEKAARDRLDLQLSRIQDNPAALAQMASALDQGAFPDVPEEYRLDRRQSIVKLLDRAEAKQRAAALAASDRVLSDIKIATIDATSPLQLDKLRAETERLWQSGTISPTERVSSVGAIEAKRVAMVRDQATGIEAQVALSAGTLKSQAQADDAFSAVVAATPQYAAMTPEQQLDFGLGFAAQAGYLPNPVRLAIENAEHTSNPLELARGAAIEQRVREVAPNARRDPGPRVLDTIALSDQGQIPITDAAARINEQILDKAIREERDAQFADAFPDFDPRAFLIDQGLATVPRTLRPDAVATIDAAEARHAEEALRLAYQQTGDPTRAQTVATAWLRQQGFGVSSLGGGEPRFQRYAPELMIPPGVPATAIDAFTPDLFGSIIGADIRRMVGEQIAPALVEGIPDFALRPIPGVTERQIQAGERPEYQVLVRSEDQILTPAIATFDDGNSTFLRYRLPDLGEVQSSETWQQLLRGELSDLAEPVPAFPPVVP